VLRRLIDGFRSRRRLRAADLSIAEGNRAEARGELSTACEHYRAAVQAAPQYAAAHLNLGVGLEKAGDPQGALSSYERSLALEPASPYANYNLAKLSYLAGDPERAAQALAAALRAKPGFPEANVLLAQLHESRGELDAAAAALSAAVEQRPGYAGALCNYGTVLRKLGRWNEAEKALRQALAAEPNYADAITGLAELLTQLGRLAEAAACYEQAVALQPRAAGIQWQLGNVLADQGRLDDATWRYRQALSFAPDLVEAQHSLCMIVYAKDRPAEAVTCLRALLARHPNFARASVSLGNILRGERLLGEAAAAFDRAIELEPALADAHFGAGNVARDRDDGSAALRHYENTLRLAPNHVRARWAAAMSRLPAVSTTPEAARGARTEFSARLEDLDRWIGDDPGLTAVQAVGEQTPFYLAYCEEDNRDLQQRHGALCARVMAGWLSRQKLPRDDAKRQEGIIRVGVVSAHFHNHSVWNALIKGWFEHLDRKRFALEAYSLGPQSDSETRAARSLAAHFEAGSGSLNRWTQAIAKRRPDVLVYPEIGMDPMSVKLASLRLAPVQVATWGHPQTTGLPTIDYFVSAQDLEPEPADAHYSEKLVRLPHLGCCYAMPTAASDSGAAPAIDAAGPLLICPGTPFKYAPEHDAVLARIAAGLEHSRLVFFRHRIPELSDKLERRLRSEFDRQGVDPKKLLFIPWQAPAAFRQLMRRSSVLLDTIGFSGFNTAMQAVECGLPVVTREGMYLRGRLASGVLKRLGLTELIASSEDDYVQRALKLCRDTGYRDEISRRMAAEAGILYDDRAPIRALEDFLAGVVAEH